MGERRVQKLAHLRTSTQSFIDGAYRELWRENGSQNPNVFAFARGTGSAARVIVISNGAAASGTMHIPMPNDIFANGQLVVNMPAKSAAIYRVEP